MSIEQTPNEVEQVSNASLEDTESRNSAFEKQRTAYKDAVEDFKNHDSVELESEQILFRGRLAESGPEVAIGGLDLKIDAAKAEREKCIENGDPYAERAWAIRQESLEAMKKVFCMYCDVKEVSPEFAAYLEAQHPWLVEKLDEAERVVNDSTDNLPEAEQVQ